MYIFDLDPASIAFEINHNQVALTSAQEAQAEDFWQKKLLSNPSLFNGDQFSTSKIVIQQQQLKMYISKTCFKHHLWMQDQAHKTAGVVILGTGVYVYDENFLYLVRRKNVISNSGKLATVVGSVDYDADVKAENFLDYLRSATFKELSEEVVLTSHPDINDMEYVGLVVQEEDSISRFRFMIKGRIEKPLGDENSEVLEVKWEDLERFYTANSSNLITSDLTFIKYYFIDRKIWKK